MRHLQAMHLKEEVISRSASWQSSLEAARNEILEKREKQAIERRKKTTKKRSNESAINESPFNSSIKNSNFHSDSEYFKGGDNVSRVICVIPW